jgi:hypothetical protein
MVTLKKPQSDLAKVGVANMLMRSAIPIAVTTKRYDLILLINEDIGISLFLFE